MTGLGILNNKQAFNWMGISVPMTKMDHLNKILVNNSWENKNKAKKERFEGVKTLDTVYTIIDPYIVASNQNHLTEE